MANHKFKIGQTVEPANGLSKPGSGPMYEIVSLLPSEGQEPRYRVRRPGSPERVVVESQVAFVKDAPVSVGKPGISVMASRK